MYKVDIPPDQREMLAVEARRRREESRKKVVFNARERTMGLDLSTINAQVSTLFGEIIVPTRPSI